MEEFVAKSIHVNEFWLRIMKEHAIFIEAGLPCSKPDLIEGARFFRMQYEALQKKLQQMKESSKEEIIAFNTQALGLTMRYIQYKTTVLQYNLTCQMPLQNLYALLLDHVRREAVEFTRELQKLLQGLKELPGYKIMYEQVFWTRIMADHSKFIAHLLDPSERRLEKEARGFSELFDDLKQQAVDLEGMISPSYMLIPTIDRFTDDVILSTEKLRDFKKAARDLIAECKILSEIPELLADHVLREAEHFLEHLKENKELIKMVQKAPTCKKQ